MWSCLADRSIVNSITRTYTARDDPQRHWELGESQESEDVGASSKANVCDVVRLEEVKRVEPAYSGTEEEPPLKVWSG